MRQQGFIFELINNTRLLISLYLYFIIINFNLIGSRVVTSVPGSIPAEGHFFLSLPLFPVSLFAIYCQIIAKNAEKK